MIENLRAKKERAAPVGSRKTARVWHVRLRKSYISAIAKLLQQLFKVAKSFNVKFSDSLIILG